MGDVINMPVRETGAGTGIKITLPKFRPLPWRVSFGAALMAVGAAMMGIKFNVE